MRQLIFSAFLLLTALPLGASILEVKTVDRHAGTVSLQASGASMHAFLRTVELRTGRSIVADFVDFRFRADIEGGTILETLEVLADRLGLELIEQGRTLVVRDAGDAAVRLDVVDASAKSIVESLARQCSIRNLMMDESIDVKGTFVFDDVPCSIAFRTVFGSLGLSGRLEPSSVLVVERAR